VDAELEMNSINHAELFGLPCGEIKIESSFRGAQLQPRMLVEMWILSPSELEYSRQLFAQGARAFSIGPFVIRVCCLAVSKVGHNSPVLFISFGLQDQQRL
jgi:hypothetical protein